MIFKKGKPNLIICLIQEDYDAAKPDRKMGEARERVSRLIGNCATADCLHDEKASIVAPQFESSLNRQPPI